MTWRIFGGGSGVSVVNCEPLLSGRGVLTVLQSEHSGETEKRSAKRMSVMVK